MADISAWGNWGANADNPAMNHPSSLKPDDKKLVWYSSAYKDQVYGNPQTFSFTDVVATVILPFSLPGVTGQSEVPTVQLPGLTLISISEHRDVYPVVSLGRRGIKGFTTGHRTTAGTFGFVLFGESPFAEVLRKYAIWKGTPSDTYFSSPDELPPFDLSLVMHNDRGDAATILIRSVKILDQSKNISVRDIQLTEVYSWMAAKVTTLVNAVQEIKYSPNLPQRYDTPDNAFLEKKAATSQTTVTTNTVTTPPTTSSTTSTTTTSSTTTSSTTTSSTTLTTHTVSFTAATTAPVPTTSSATASLTAVPTPPNTNDTFTDVTNNTNSATLSLGPTGTISTGATTTLLPTLTLDGGD